MRKNWLVWLQALLAMGLATFLMGSGCGQPKDDTDNETVVDTDGDGKPDVDEPPTWWVSAVAVSTDDLSGNMSEQVVDMIKGMLRARAVASDNAQYILTEVLNDAKNKDFERAYLNIDINSYTIGTALLFTKYEPANNWARAGIGFPSIQFSGDSFLANEFRLPIQVRKNGPILAVSETTLAAYETFFAAVGAELNGLVGVSYDDPSEIPEGLTQADIDYMNGQLTYAINDVLDSIKNLPQIPNDAGTASFSDTYSWDLSTLDEEFEGFVDGEPVYSGSLNQFHVDASAEFNMDLNADGDRWTGAGAISGSLIRPETEAMTLGLSAAIGLQRIDDPTVVNLEGGDGTVVDGTRLAGTWTATLSASTLGLDRLYSKSLKSSLVAKAVGVIQSTIAEEDLSIVLKLVMGDNGEFQNVLVAYKYSDEELTDDDFISLTKELADLRADMAEDEVTLAQEQLKTTIDADGNVRLDITVPGLGETLKDYIDARRGSLPLIGTSLSELDLSQLPDLPIVSFVGKVNGTTLDGDVICLILAQPVTFTK